MRRFIFVTVALAAACSRETPAPPQPSQTTTAAATATQPAETATRVPELQKGSYDEALLWFRSTPGFRFVLDDRGVHAEGEMTRTTPGREKVQFTAGGAEWLAETTAQGVSWKRRATTGGAWQNVDAPEFGPRLYQRVTLPFDPQKKEGVPLLASEEGPANLYRFTNANTGEVHELWVRKSDAAVERVKIGDAVVLTIEAR